jgi:hypothetical protein
MPCRSFSAPLSSLPNRCIFEQLQEPNVNYAGGIVPSAHFFVLLDDCPLSSFIMLLGFVVF